MSFIEASLKNWAEFERIASIYARLYVDHGGPLFRGQADSTWLLTPSFLRVCREQTAARALKLELDLLAVFEGRVHLVADPAEQLPVSPYHSLPERWALMQHHAAPTRLLDWTESIYVALYFAVRSQDGVDGALFCVNSGIVIPEIPGPPPAEHPWNSKVNEDTLLQDFDAEPNVRIWFPAHKSKRLAMQQGLFTYSTHVLGDQHSMFAAGAEKYRARYSGADAFTKYVVPADLKRDFLARLNCMNVGSHTLFPDLVGLGTYVAELAKLGLFPESAPSAQRL